MKLVTMKEAINLVGYTRTHIDRLEKLGRFPKRCKPSGMPNGKVFYSEEELFAWMRQHLQARS